MMKRLSIFYFAVITLFLCNNCVGLYAQNALKTVTLEDVWKNNTFRTRGVQQFTPLKSGEHYCLLEKDGIVEYEYKTGNKTKIILSFESIEKLDASVKDLDDFSFNTDETKILFSTNSEPLYRRSAISDYFVYNTTDNKLHKISDKGKVRLASISPDGNSVAFVRDNNLFVKNLINNTETEITNDGKWNHIINGATDWVYEEEFEFSQAFFWSPDGSKVAYYKFDESKVKEFQMAMYGTLYPEQYSYKYPKAGEDNSIVSIYVYDVKANKSVKVDIGTETNIYIPRIKWTRNSNLLAVYCLNRLQNNLEILAADATTGKTSILYKEENKYYVEINDEIFFLENGKQFIITNSKNKFNHIYMYDMTGKEIAQLTDGKYDVLSIIAVNEKDKTIYYSSSEDSPTCKMIYSVDFTGKKKTKITPRLGTNNIVFSGNFKYYVLSFSDANTPSIITLNTTSNHKVIRELENNSKLVEKMKEYKLSKKEFFSFTTENGISLNAWMIKPYNFDSTKKYPVLMYVYGGPGSQTVNNAWERAGDYFWYQMLAEKGYMIVSVDGRGTGARGEEFKKCTYMQLGNLETIDQIASAKYLGTLKYVDAKRIGIFGWSYGGYMSTLCMTKGAEYFKAGIAVAPVSNWRYYDNIYTERYMRTPQENGKSYDENSPINHVDKLVGKYILIHGTADDNVHLQNAVELSDALIKANKPFEMMYYPNKNHGIYGGNTRLHLYSKMTEFLLNNL